MAGFKNWTRNQWRAFHVRRGTYKALAHPQAIRKKRVAAMKRKYVKKGSMVPSPAGPLVGLVPAVSQASSRKIRAYKRKYPFGARPY